MLLVAGLLLLLALVSFDPADVPSWVFFSHVTPPNPKIGNFVGIVGVLVAGLLYFLFGAASYLIAVLLLGFGAAKLLFDRFRLKGRIGWSFLFILCGASLLNLQPWFLADWDRAFHIEGPGGWFGKYVGEKAFGNALGFVGSAVVLLGLYLASLILLTGFHPIRFVRMCFAGVGRWFADRKKRKLDRLTEEELFKKNQRELEKTTEKLEKKLRRKKNESSGPEPGLPPEAPQTFPEPKIIDASVPAPSKKPPAPPPRLKKSDKDAITTGLQEVHLENYTLPTVDLLDPADDAGRIPADPAVLKGIQDHIIDTLGQFGIEASPGDITKGPTITRFEIYPAKGVRVDRITALERDIARATRAERINILAPIPGKDTVGIEIANASKVKVTLRELFESEAWANTKARLPLALGKDVYGNTIIASLGLGGAYGIYAVCAVISIFFIAKMVKETKGKTLEEME